MSLWCPCVLVEVLSGILPGCFLLKKFIVRMKSRAGCSGVRQGKHKGSVVWKSLLAPRGVGSRERCLLHLG